MKTACTFIVSAAFLVAAFAMPAIGAAPVAFPDIDVSTSSEVHYACGGGKEVAVRYINASNGDSFAYLPVDGTKHVFVSVMSGSGVRYASGRYVWWSKGETGKLIVDGDESAPPLLADCAAKR